MIYLFSHNVYFLRVACYRTDMRGHDDPIAVNPGFRKPVFSRTEIREIAGAVTLLSVAMAIVLSGGLAGLYRTGPGMFILLLAISAVLIVFSFLLHELAHKFTAQKYGAWAEFRMYPGGLMLAIVMSLFGFLFAAPGAVYINGRITEEMNGRISMAGPLVNLLLATGAVVFVPFTTGILSDVAFMMAYFNAFLALFNMLPIPPLDGSKIFRWNRGAYIAMFSWGIVVLALAFLI